MTTTKTYLVTDKLETPLPQNFLNSTNKKYIEIQNVNVYNCNSNKPLENAFMHVNFIHDRPYLDNLVVPANHVQTKYKTYEFKGNEDSLILRFSEGEPSVPTNVGDAFLFNRTLVGKYNFNNAQDFDLFVLYSHLFIKIFSKEQYTLWSNKVELEDDDFRLDTIKEDYKNLPAKYPDYFNDKDNLEGYKNLFDGLSIIVYKYEMNNLEYLYKWYEKYIVQKCIKHNNMLNALYQFFMSKYEMVFQYMFAFIKDDTFNFNNVAWLLVNVIFNFDIDYELFVKSLFESNFDYNSTSENECIKYSLYYHLVQKQNIFRYNKEDYNNFVEFGQIVLQYTIPVDKVNKLQEVLGYIGDSTLSLQDIINRANLNGIYNINFIEPDDSIARQFLLKQLCNLLCGKEQKEEEWYLYKRYYVDGNLHIDQISNDSLTGKALVRTIKYENTKTVSTSTIGPTKLLNYRLPYEYIGFYNDTYNMLTKIVTTTYNLDSFEYYNSKTKIVQKDIDDFNDIIDRIKKLPSQREEYFKNENNNTLYEIIIDFINEVKIDDLIYQYEIYICARLIYWYYEYIKNNNATENTIEAMDMTIAIILEASLKLEPFINYENNKDSIGDNKYTYIYLFCLYILNPLVFTIETVNDLCLEYKTEWLDKGHRNIYGFGNYMIFCYTDSKGSYFRHNYDDYTFFIRFYKSLLYYEPLVLKEFDFGILFAIAKYVYEGKDINAILMDFGFKKDAYHLNFEETDKDIKNDVLFKQLCELACGKEQKEEVWTEKAVKVVGDEEIHTEVTNDSLTNIELTRERRIALDGFPNEQTYFDINGDEKYNYRFFAEFMLIY